MRLSAVEEQHRGLEHLPGATPTPMCSIAIPVKGSEISALAWIALWEVSPTTNAVLKQTGSLLDKDDAQGNFWSSVAEQCCLGRFAIDVGQHVLILSTLIIMGQLFFSIIQNT